MTIQEISDDDLLVYINRIFSDNKLKTAWEKGTSLSIVYLDDLKLTEKETKKHFRGTSRTLTDCIGMFLTSGDDNIRYTDSVTERDYEAEIKSYVRCVKQYVKFCFKNKHNEDTEKRTPSLSKLPNATYNFVRVVMRDIKSLDNPTIEQFDLIYPSEPISNPNSFYGKCQDEFLWNSDVYKDFLTSMAEFIISYWNILENELELTNIYEEAMCENSHIRFVKKSTFTKLCRITAMGKLTDDKESVNKKYQNLVKKMVEERGIIRINRDVSSILFEHKGNLDEFTEEQPSN